MSRAVIFGTGSMARVLFSFVADIVHVSAFVADDKFVTGDRFHNRPLVKLSELYAAYPPSQYSIYMAIGFHEMNETRAKHFNALRGMGYHFPQFVPRLWWHDEVTIGEGAVIYDHVAIHAGSTVGENVFISSNVSVGHDCVIGEHAWINSGVTLGGGVWVGERCVLGMGATIAQGVKLGAGTFVGANTLVTQNTTPDSVVVSQHGHVLGMIPVAFDSIPPCDSKRFLKLTGQP